MRRTLAKRRKRQPGGRGGVVAKLHADPVFLAQLEEAKKELNNVRAKNLIPAIDCQAENTALTFGYVK